jgi:hypothetical protein
MEFHDYKPDGIKSLRELSTARLAYLTQTVPLDRWLWGAARAELNRRLTAAKRDRGPTPVRRPGQQRR